MIKNIKTDKAPKAIGPYSAGLELDDFVYISGQLPVDPKEGKIVTEDVGEQAKQSLTNIKSILEEVGLNMSNVVKTTVLLKDINDFAKVNEVYATFFEEPYPTRAAYQVVALPAGALVEIEAVAYKNK